MEQLDAEIAMNVVTTNEVAPSLKHELQRTLTDSRRNKPNVKQQTQRLACARIVKSRVIIKERVQHW